MLSVIYPRMEVQISNIVLGIIERCLGGVKVILVDIFRIGDINDHHGLKKPLIFTPNNGFVS